MADDSLFASLAKEFSKEDVTTDPVGWTKEVLDGFLWSKQQEIVESVLHNRKTAVRSAHSTGKSYLAALIACWWISIHPPGTAFVVTTAPSSKQVHAILWEYMRRMHRIGNLPGKVQLSDNWIIGETLVGFGRKPQDYDQHAFQGIHRDHVLVILDEACGINKWLWDAADVIAIGDTDRILAIGNPDDPASEFAQVCKPGSSWHKIKISAFDTPSFTGEDVPQHLKEALIQPSWVEGKKKDWGENHPYWSSKVLAEFPQVDDFATIPLGWITEANARWEEWAESGMPDPGGRKILGVDVARFGTDNTVIAKRIGDVIYPLESFSKLDTEVVADLVARRMHGRNPRAVIDVIGIGAGVFDKLNRSGFSVVGFNAGARTSLVDASRENGFNSIRAAGWWRLREALDPSRGATLCLPPDEQLTADLISPRWDNVLGGKIAVESKDEVRKRLGRSTDRADAVIMAMWIHGGEVLDTDQSSFAWTDRSIPDSENGDELPRGRESCRRILKALPAHDRHRGTPKLP